MIAKLFENRSEAARKLAPLLKSRKLYDPIVLGIPRGGAVVASELAKALNAEFDIVIARKIRAPFQSELAIGAVGEDGQTFLNAEALRISGVDKDYISAERENELREIERRQELFRAARPQARVEGRSVIVTDDGIATGASMIAALQTLTARRPKEVIVAVPAASPERLEVVKRYCNDVVCATSTPNFYAVGQFYKDFDQVEDGEVVSLLKSEARNLSSAA